MPREADLPQRRRAAGGNEGTRSPAAQGLRERAEELRRAGEALRTDREASHAANVELRARSTSARRHAIQARQAAERTRRAVADAGSTADRAMADVKAKRGKPSSS